MSSNKYDCCFGKCLSLIYFKHYISETEVSYEKPPGQTTDMLATLIIAVRRGRLVTGSLDRPADLGHLQLLQAVTSHSSSSAQVPYKSPH